jgi:hypothetical protein
MFELAALAAAVIVFDRSQPLMIVCDRHSPLRSSSRLNKARKKLAPVADPSEQDILHKVHTWAKIRINFCH